MRKSVTAAVTVLGLLALVLAPGARADDPAAVGSFSAPFREDAFKRPGTAGCVAKPDGTFDCLPAAAATMGLANGKVLYWNNLEGSENIQMNTVAEIGDRALDDRSRVLGIDFADPSRSAWAEPSPADGGANPNGNSISDVGAPSDP